LGDLAEPISEEGVDRFEIVAFLPLSVVLEVALALGNPVLVGDAVTQVAERVIKDDGRADVARIGQLASGLSAVASHSVVLEQRPVRLCLKVGLGSHFYL